MIRAETIQKKGEFTRQAGRQMAGDLVRQLGRPPDACWLFCSPQKNMESFVQGVYDAAGTPHLVGCTTDGEITGNGFSTGSAVLGGVVSDQIRFEVAAADGVGADSEGAGRRLAESFSGPVRCIQLFSDGITGNGSAILRGMGSVIGTEVPVSGGTAGDAGKFRKTWQFHGNRVLSDAAVAIAFSGRFALGTGVRSGWSPIGLPKRVTRASGNVLYELNGEPALSVYERFLGKHAERLPTVGVEYPLGLIGQLDGDAENDHLLLRATMSVNREDGSIRFAGEVPEGAMVYLTCGDRSSILDATEEAVRMALENLGEAANPALVFFYSCMARKILLGLRTKEEIERVRSVIDPGVPVLGFYSYGEYCRASPEGPSLLHNETATLSIIGT